MTSWQRPPIAFWNEANGDLPRRSLVGRSTGAHRIGSGVQAAGCHSAGGRLEPQPDLYRRVRAADHESALGERAGERPPSARLTGLPKDSVANVSQVLTLDRDLLTERVGKLPRAKVALLFIGIDIVLGR